MYDHLVGTPVEQSPGRLVLRVGGVGYELATPLTARFADAGEVLVHTHLVVRDDAHLLFGFPDAAGRAAFRLLLGVNRVGPAVALSLLAHLSRRQLLEAAAAGDARAFLAVKGVGKRIAEQIVLDLKDKAAKLLLDEQAGPARTVDARTRAQDDAVGALVSIGYAEKDARKAVELAARAEPGADVPALIRLALRAR
ncbi:MAG: Holliday junction branch migration protein RuvA [Planctomycetota bacterium]|nr:MAG: Holliday junction branch migration protein RuvA [Planctomycetota bacterium]